MAHLEKIWPQHYQGKHHLGHRDDSHLDHRAFDTNLAKPATGRNCT